MARKKKCSRQELFEFKSWGGARKGAGRKRKGERARVSHRMREKLASRFPVHVTTRLRAGLPSLRRVRERRVLERAFGAGSDRSSFRLTEYSIQSNHLHLLVEAKDRNALTRGMQGLSIRVAKALNKLWERKGKVFADRYHDRILRTPREVRNALVYVLKNHARHGIRLLGVDAWSSGRWFEGWKATRGVPVTLAPRASPIARARTWLLNVGWRRRGRIAFTESPAR